MSTLPTGEPWQHQRSAPPTADQPHQPERNGHIAYLDGLRGVAIMAVVLVHTSLDVGLETPLRNFTFYGVHGVQLFFIVSGMTLMLAHLDRPLNLTNFAARRFFRIAPMFYLGAILYLAVGAWTDLHSGTRNASAFNIGSTVLFLHGWLPNAGDKVVPGGWSIAVEAMLYVVFPAILGLGRHPRRLAAFVVGSYVVAGATNLLLLSLLPPIPSSHGFALSFWLCQLPAFAGGCLIAVVGRQQIVSRSTALLALAGSVVALIIDSQMRAYTNLLVAIFLLTVFVWAIANVQPRIFQSGFLPFLGRISFSVYILHFLVLDLVNEAFRRITLPTPPIVSLLLIYIATLVVVAALATVTLRYIEQPFVRIGRRFGARRAATA